MASNNFNGLSAYAGSKEARLRSFRKRRFLGELRKKNDVVMCQETHLNENDKNYLNNNEDGSLVFYNNGKDKSAGVATIIGKRLCKIYNPIKMDLNNDAEGRVLSIYMEPKTDKHRGFYIDNVYLQSGSSMAPKHRQIKSLRHNADDLVFMGGDFNFTEREGDGGTKLKGKTNSLAGLLL